MRNALDVYIDVASPDDIRLEIEQLTARRAELFHALSEGHDPALTREHSEVEEQIARLWDAHRAARARLRHGDRDGIIRRARQEERLERAA